MRPALEAVSTEYDEIGEILEGYDMQQCNGNRARKVFIFDGGEFAEV